jgi:ABC-type branched-subunit amino acid transport system substrate-binding protein
VPARPHLLPVFLLALLLPALLCAGGPPARGQIERGRRIYDEGVSPAGGEITAVMGDEEVEVPASALPCASCHGRDGKGRPEGGVSPSDVTWANLSKPYGLTHPDGRKHPAYDVRTLKRAVSLAIDPAGNKLNPVMPRYRMSLQDMEDLLAYLQQLGTGSEPGVSETALRIGVVLPPAGPLSGMGQAVRAALTARFEQLNQQGGLYGRRLEPRFLEAPAAADQRKAWTADFLDREQVFAGVAGFLASADAELAGLFEEKRIPLIGPFTLHPREAFPLNRYVFYLLPGVEAQGQALVLFVRGQGEGKPLAAVVAPAGEDLDGAVEAVLKAAASAGWPKPLVLRLGQGSGEQDLERLAAVKADPVFFLGSGPEGLTLLQAAGRLGWHPRFLATAAASDGSLFGAPAAFAGRIFLALPGAPGGPGPDAASAYQALASAAKLPTEHLSAQLSALAAAEVLIEALERAGRDVSREKLVDQLEALRAFASGYAPPVTYGPNRRLGARGAYVARVGLQEKRLAQESGWIEVHQP